MNVAPFAFEMRNITKRFPGVVANNNVSFAAKKGEVHALLGENGAGKSTLMNILAGLYRQDAGSILVDGRPVEFTSPRDAIQAGVGMVHQHFMLVPSQTVAENIILGMRDVDFIIDTRAIEKRVEEISHQYGLPVDPQAKVWQLSVGEQQRVEIIKLLYRGAQILILDEPTAVLTPQETEVFFETLRIMTSAGKTIVFISHKLDEVLSIADRITILRTGRYVATVTASGLTKSELASLMVGREVLFQVDKPPVETGEVRLRLHEVEALDDKGLPALRGLTLDVRSREIVGIAGVAGNGQREFAEVISGLRAVTGGAITIENQHITDAPPLVIIEAGIAYVPEDRSATGSAPNLSVAENLALKNYRNPNMSRGPFLSREGIRNQAQKLIEVFDIATPSPNTAARLLSGGNLQKVILARELAQEPVAIIAAYPTRGLDVGATENVRKILIRERGRGAAILLISEDLDEIFALSDRIAVLYEGRVVGEVDVQSATREQVGLLMAGERLPTTDISPADASPTHAH